MIKLLLSMKHSFWKSSFSCFSIWVFSFVFMSFTNKSIWFLMSWWDRDFCWLFWRELCRRSCLCKSCLLHHHSIFGDMIKKLCLNCHLCKRFVYGLWNLSIWFNFLLILEIIIQFSALAWSVFISLCKQMSLLFNIIDTIVVKKLWLGSYFRYYLGVTLIYWLWIYCWKLSGWTSLR